MRTSPVLALVLLGASVAPVAGDDSKAAKPAADLPEIKELPSPFTFSDGSAVKTKADWERRRKELKDLFQDYVYGHLPPKPKTTITKGKVVVDKDTQTAVQDLTLKMENGDKELTLKVRVAWPDGAKKPVPVVVQSTFFGGVGGKPSGKPFSAFIKRGFGVAQLSLHDVASDSKARARKSGVYLLYGDEIDCGALMAWAWGFHRVIDAIETVDKLNAKQVVVTGHSRYGKAALVAGAFDDRVALTVPSHSGCAGAAPYRLIYGKSEQLHNIVGAFPYWFRPDFNQFVGKVERLPVDQHLLLALVAPRPLLMAEGTKDSWTNPEGVQQTYAGAKKVYDFLKAGEKISVRYRPVGHVPNNGDLMDFADHVFSKKALPKEFGKLEYKEDKKAIPWGAPK